MPDAQPRQRGATLPPPHALVAPPSATHVLLPQRRSRFHVFVPVARVPRFCGSECQLPEMPGLHFRSEHRNR